MAARETRVRSTRVSHRSLLRRALILMAVALMATIGATEGIKHIAFLTFVDRFVSDWEIAALSPAEPQDPDIVIVAITEDTLRQFPYRSPIDRHFLSELLKAVVARGPRAIGIDIFFDQPTEPAKDDELRATLLSITVPLVVSYFANDGAKDPSEFAFEDSFVPPPLRVLSTLATDQFDTARWIYPGRRIADGTYVNGFARGLAAAIGVTAPVALVPISWHGRPSRNISPFAEYPAELVPSLPAAWLKDKIILIGVDASLTDRHRTPFSTIFEGDEGLLPGVVIDAHSLAQLLEHRAPQEIGDLWNFIIVMLCALIGALLPTLRGPLTARLGAGVVLLIILWLGGAALFHYAGLIIGLIAPTLALAASQWTMEAITGRDARRQREFIKGAFSHYVSPKVVETLIADPSKVSLQGERRVMTFLFTDLANFTTLSESLDADLLASTLNSYFEGMTEIVLKYDGTLDKFEGDAIFVIFNAPVDQKDHPLRAVRCALEMDRFAEKFRAEQNAQGIPFGQTRIGIHTGAAVVGNFGSRTRFDYSANGDAVNTAARLEGVNKQFGTRICVSDATRAECPGIEFRPLGAVIVKGKSKNIGIWEPLHADRDDGGFLKRYREAYAKLEASSSDALPLFSSLNTDYPADRSVSLHLERLKRGECGVELALSEK